MSIQARRVLARASIAVCFACLVAVAIGAWTIHHSLIQTVIAAAFPVAGVLCGLEYLRSTRRRP